jgi:phytanoyl-CoA hydroxylase
MPHGDKLDQFRSTRRIKGMARSAPTALSRFEQDGYVVFPQVLDGELMAEASRHVEWLQAKYPELRPEQLGHNLMTNDAFWHRLVSDPRLLDIAEQFIGPNIALFASHYISKPPFDGQPVLWHQDGSYWPLEPMEVVTLWLAVDDADAENGCMQVIPGTHRMPLQQLHERTDTANVLNSEVDPALVDETQAIDIVLSAGSVSIHHPNIIHGSKANLSARRRCGLTIRYIPSSTHILAPQPWPSAFLLRGHAFPGINKYQPRPRYQPGESMEFQDAEQYL